MNQESFKQTEEAKLIHVEESKSLNLITLNDSDWTLANKNIETQKSVNTNITLYKQLTVYQGNSIDSKFLETIKIQLNFDKLFITNETNTKEKPITMHFEDFIGVELSKNNINKSLYRIIFHTTEYEDIKNQTKNKRLIKSKVYLSDSLPNLKSFRTTLMTCFWNWIQTTYKSGINSSTSYDHSGLKSYEKRVLFIINPKGGKGEAVSLYKSISRYIIASGILPTVIKTSYRPHALEIIKDMPAEEFKRYYAIVSVGGDGISHEIVNGFYQRADHMDLQLRLGFLLGGSACSIAYGACMNWSLCKSQINCLFVQTRGRFNPMSITEYKTNGDHPKIYGIMCYNFGYISDVDFNSEKMRWLGQQRLKSYGYLKQLNQEKRPCKISWTDEVIDNKDIGQDDEVGENWKHYNGLTYNFSYVQIPFQTDDFSITYDIEFGMDVAQAWIAPKKNGFWTFIKSMLAAEKGEIDKVEKAMTMKMKGFRLELGEGKKYGKENTPINIDGESYEGTKIQGMILNDKIAIIS